MLLYKFTHFQFIKGRHTFVISKPGNVEMVKMFAFHNYFQISLVPNHFSTDKTKTFNCQILSLE